MLFSHKDILKAMGTNFDSVESVNSFLSSLKKDAINKQIDYDKLWEYFQERQGKDIYASNVDIYLGSIPQMSDEGAPFWVEINGPNEYPYQYCKNKKDLPELVNDFITEGGTLSDITKEIS